MIHRRRFLAGLAGIFAAPVVGMIPKAVAGPAYWNAILAQGMRLICHGNPESPNWIEAARYHAIQAYYINDPDIYFEVKSQ